MTDLALPVVVVRDQAAAAGPLVRDAAAALAGCVYLRTRTLHKGRAYQLQSCKSGPAAYFWAAANT